MTKRILAVLLSIVLVLSCIPFGAGAESAQPTVLTERDYASADAVFEAIDSMEAVRSTRSANQSQRTDAAQALVLASDSYVEGSLERNGDAFTWMTTDGIRCAYNPRMREIYKNMTPPEASETDGIYNEPMAVRGGFPQGKQVYLVGPYYGYDDNFTDQYKNEAKRIATAIGDTDGYTLYSGKAATVDKVAEAVSKGAVVFFDSHGTTDYESGNDCVTGATSSYLCLTSTTGLTDADYDDGALYSNSGIYINGATIANHMKTNSPSGILWMALCLGMATNTICNPLREKGVEVVCGYSQSVTFAGDYLFEDAFWDKMCEGQTVAQANSYMKSTWGNWDWSTKIAKHYGYSDGYSTISSARADYTAFPVVVSDEDKHPGQRNKNVFYGADSLQTVKSTYTVFNQYSITANSDPSQGTVSVSGNIITAEPAAGYIVQDYTILSGSATVTQEGNVFYVEASSDCVICINFIPKDKFAVTFRGAEVAPVTVYKGESISLPIPETPEGITFIGWMDTALEAHTTTQPAYYTGSYTPTESTTLYALYSYVAGGSGAYVKLTESPEDWSGDYLIVYEPFQYVLDSGSSRISKANNYKEVVISNGTIPAEQGDPCRFIVAPYGSGYSILATSGKYIGKNANTDGFYTPTNPLMNQLSISADGSAEIIAEFGPRLRFDTAASSLRFNFYRTNRYGNYEKISLYKKDGVLWFAPEPKAICYHTAVEAGICTGCGLSFGARTTDGYWETLQEAIDNAKDGYVQLLKDAEEAVTATTLYLDLNGYMLQEITVTKALYGYDSTATAKEEDSGGILAVHGPVVQDHYVNGIRYITLENGGIYTFHVLEMRLDTVSLRTGETGIYYQGSIDCDDTLRSRISGYGIALSTVDMPGIDYREAHNLYTENTGAPEEDFASVMVSGILKENALDNDSRGKMAIYANVYLELTDGTVLLSDNTSTDTKEASGFDGVAFSLYDMMTILDQTATALSDSQLTRLQQFCSTWQDAMLDWKLSNLKGV